MKNFIFFILAFAIYDLNAQDAKQIESLTEKHLLKDSVIASGHIGIAIYDAGTKKFIYDYQSNKYFLPASTAKLFTLYAGLKFLGDSLNGINYKVDKDTLFVIPSGDPTFMHDDFQQQRIHQFLNNSKYPIVFLDEGNYPEPYAAGWSMDDVDESFMPQRSRFPVNGNLFSMEWIKNSSVDSFPFSLVMISSDFPDFSISKKINTDAGNSVHRTPGKNQFEVTFNNKEIKVPLEVPFEVSGVETGFHILKNMLYHTPIKRKTVITNKLDFLEYHSQPTDSVLSLMMHRSDNFYAEQLLLMVGEKISGKLNQSDAMNYLLENDLKDLPQKPRWVDGSGLSRYNLFSPKDEVVVMQKLVDSFGISRIKKILPAGGTGTMKKMFTEDGDSIFAKTGSMSNNYCLSGMLYTAKGKVFYFSVMLNNYQGSAKVVRRLIEGYLHEVRMRN